MHRLAEQTQPRNDAPLSVDGERGPLFAYRARLQAGQLTPDPVQELAAEKLQSLHHALAGYRPATGRSGWRARLGLARRKAEPAPQGLYLFGGVGRGKSMLMDLFFASAPVERKKRVHFHAFMLNVHDRLHVRRQQAKGKNLSDTDQALMVIARDIAAEAWLLCFDEFHVTDVADAMILSRLFTQLFDQGVVVVATSNWPPDDLYKDGLNRARFLPFIDLLKRRLDILELDGETDHRRARIKGMSVYYHPLGLAAEQRMAEAFGRLTEGAVAEPCTLTVKGHDLPVDKAARGVAWFDFDGLMRGAFGAGDFLAIATHFHTVFLDGVPKIPAVERNIAKRFMLFIDALYEHRCKLIIAADGAPEVVYDPTGALAFEFQRTVSRLLEMQAEDYLAQPHLT